MKRSLIVLVTLFMCVTALVVSVLSSSVNSNSSSSSAYCIDNIRIREAIIRGIGALAFEHAGGRIVSYEEFVEFVKSRNLTIYLPTYLPEGFTLTAIWARDRGYLGGQGLDFPLIIIYSKDPDDKCYAAKEGQVGMEITLESPAPLKQYIESGGLPIYDGEGRLIGVLFKDAYCPTCRYRETIPLAIVRLGGLEYRMSFDDPDVLVEIVISMKPLTIE